MQVGVRIDMKDYLSTIISSLLCFLSSFALVQLTAARMHALLKMIEPDVLLPLLIEGADESTVGAEKGSDKDKKRPLLLERIVKA